MKKFYWLVSVVVLMSIAGCGTIKGLGEDISAVGGWFSRGSTHVQENIGRGSSDLDY
jgi:predicted small secreted protein